MCEQVSAGGFTVKIANWDGRARGEAAAIPEPRDMPPAAHCKYCGNTIIDGLCSNCGRDPNALFVGDSDDPCNCCGGDHGRQMVEGEHCDGCDRHEIDAEPEAEDDEDGTEITEPTSPFARLKRWATNVYDRQDLTGPLLWSERQEWAKATSLTDLCGLTERWLTGDLKSQPGYYGPADVDEEDAPGMTATLIALNRAGFLTENSQAGADEAGESGERWTQLAAVDGYATSVTVENLRDALQGTPYVVEAFPRRRWGISRSIVPVTWVNDAPYTRFGGGCTAKSIRFQFDGAGGRAVKEVTDALQVVIYDPTPGRNDLWTALRTATG